MESDEIIKIIAVSPEGNMYLCTKFVLINPPVIDIFESRPKMVEQLTNAAINREAHPVWLQGIKYLRSHMVTDFSAV